MHKQRRPFTRAWFTWRRMEPPVGRFRNGERRAASYEIESALDHIVSSVYSLGEGYIAGRESDFVAQSSRRLADLDGLASALDQTDVTVEERDRFRDYLTATRSVLEALRDADLSDSG